MMTGSGGSDGPAARSTLARSAASGGAVRRRSSFPRLPPGQYDTGSSWPVLTAELSPKLTPATWSFRVDGLVETAKTWDWNTAHKLAASSYEGDIHCVTTRSKLGTSFGGVSLDTLLDEVGVKPEAIHVVAWSHTGLHHEPAHRARAWRPGPDRVGARGQAVAARARPAEAMIMPHLYFWKSAKWIGGVRLLDHDEPGFWEVRGYHALGDPWKEQQYDGD